MAEFTPTEPFLRWLGGKRWLAPSLVHAMRGVIGHGTYYEPFLGSAALFLALAPARAVLSDRNAGLINTFQQVRDDPSGLLDVLRGWPVDKSTYDALREEAPTCEKRAAARFLYLNRTCYGGLYRTNRQGHFNAAFGGGSRTTAPLFEERLLERAAAVLDRPGVRVLNQDYVEALRVARRGDVVYCDPPYTDPRRSSFDRYGPELFTWQDQCRLAECARQAAARGVLVLVSNGSTPETEQLYRDAFAVRFWKRKRVGNRSNAEATHDEMLFILDPKRRDLLWATLQKRPGESFGPRRARLAATPAQLEQATA